MPFRNIRGHPYRINNLSTHLFCQQGEQSASLKVPSFVSIHLVLIFLALPSTSLKTPDIFIQVSTSRDILSQALKAADCFRLLVPGERLQVFGGQVLKKAQLVV